MSQSNPNQISVVPIMVNEENVDGKVASLKAQIEKSMKEGNPFVLITCWDVINDKIEKHFRSSLNQLCNKSNNVFMIITDRKDENVLEIGTFWGFDEKGMRETYEEMMMMM